jgi:SAM-dependent methyltransferase
VASNTIDAYNTGFAEFGAAYEAYGFAEIHHGAMPFLPATPGLLLDVGAGSGRDAAWFASAGWEVIAVEPAAFLRNDARTRHTSPRIRWIDDSLPALAAVHRLGLAFDLVWLSGVWMHVPPADRPRAMRKLATLVKPGGRLIITLRHGPAPEDRPMWPVTAHEVERLGLELGLALRVATDRADDLGRRPGITWQTIILDLPDDGAGALPLLRGVIIRQEKSATYKLALLRCIARIADASPNVARDAGDAVELPLGLIALYWLRMYKPLLDRDLPQRSTGGLGFVKDAYRALRHISAADFRPGMHLAGNDGRNLARALADAAILINDMPAQHLTYANDTPVFPTVYGRLPRAQAGFTATQENLWQFGVTRVPLHVWHAFRRMSAWIEPMLIAEWVRLIQGYQQRRPAAPGATPADIHAALRWIEPNRDTSFVRKLVQQRFDAGRAVHCVWTGRALKPNTVDIDHCLPWSAWPCDDLWNLLPSAPALNRHLKGEKLPAAATLEAARGAIKTWWQDAYLDSGPAVRVRFNEEATTSLPVLAGKGLDLDELFLALDFKRMQLRQETQAAEWLEGR